MTLTFEQFVRALTTGSWGIRFVNGRTASWFDRAKTKVTLNHTGDRRLKGPEQYRTETPEIAYAAVREETPCCQFCTGTGGHFRAADEILDDGYLVCVNCKPKVYDTYYICTECKGPLPPALAGYNRQKFESATCAKPECRKAHEVKRGLLCCTKAEYIHCVCLRAYKCPEHHPDGVHVGTHD